VRQGKIPELALRNIAEMAKVSLVELRSELLSSASLYDEIINTGRKNSRDRPGAEYQDGLELGVECGGVDVEDSCSWSSCNNCVIVRTGCC